MKSIEHPAEYTPNQENLSDSLESREIIEQAREKRLEIMVSLAQRVKERLKEIVPHKVVAMTARSLDFTPAADLKLLAELARGKTLAGEKMTPKEQLLSVLIVGSNIGAYAALVYGIETSEHIRSAFAGSALYASSWALNLAKNGPHVLESLQQLLKYTQEKGEPILQEIISRIIEVSIDALNRTRNVQ